MKTSLPIPQESNMLTMRQSRNLLPGLILAALLFAPAAGAGAGEAKQVFPENDTAGYVSVGIIVIDPAIKAASPDYNFLVLDGEGKANYLRDLSTDIDILSATDPQKETRKTGLAARLNAIWDKYPVVYETKPGSAGYPTYGGTETVIRFAPSVTSTKLTDDENAAIRESAAIMKEAFLKSIGNPADLDAAGTRAPDLYPRTFREDTGWFVVHANVDDASVDFDAERVGALSHGTLVVPVNVTGHRYKTVSVVKQGYSSMPVAIDRYPAPGEIVDLYATLNMTTTATRPPATQPAPLSPVFAILALGCAGTLMTTRGRKDA